MSSQEEARILAELENLAGQVSTLRLVVAGLLAGLPEPNRSSLVRIMGEELDSIPDDTRALMSEGFDKGASIVSRQQHKYRDPPYWGN